MLLEARLPETEDVRLFLCRGIVNPDKVGVVALQRSNRRYS
jgi:hypothetical protein